jgi:hypothetical protein
MQILWCKTVVCLIKQLKFSSVTPTILLKVALNIISQTYPNQKQKQNRTIQMSRSYK